MEKWTDIFKKWWFWVIIVTSIIIIVLAIVLPIVLINKKDSDELNLPEENDVIFQFDFDIEKNGGGDYVTYVELHGQLNISFFDENNNLFMPEKGEFDLSVIPTTVIYLVLWDSEIDYYEETGLLNLKDFFEFTIDQHFHEKIYHYDSYYMDNLLTVNQKKVNVDKNMEWSFSRIKDTNNFENGDYKYSIENLYDANDFLLVNNIYYEEIDGIEKTITKFIDFEYFDTYYMLK